MEEEDSYENTINFILEDLIFHTLKNKPKNIVRIIIYDNINIIQPKYMKKYLKKFGNYDDNAVYSYQNREINRLKSIIEKYKQYENIKNDNMLNNDGNNIQENNDENNNNINNNKYNEEYEEYEEDEKDVTFDKKNEDNINKDNENINQSNNNNNNNIINENNNIQDEIIKDENQSIINEKNDEKMDNNFEEKKDDKRCKYAEIEEEEESSEELQFIIKDLYILILLIFYNMFY